MLKTIGPREKRYAYWNRAAAAFPSFDTPESPQLLEPTWDLTKLQQFQVGQGTWVHPWAHGEMRRVELSRGVDEKVKGRVRS